VFVPTSVGYWVRPKQADWRQNFFLLSHPSRVNTQKSRKTVVFERKGESEKEEGDLCYLLAFSTNFFPFFQIPSRHRPVSVVTFFPQRTFFHTGVTSCSAWFNS
jgi:hypothetical protein